MDNTDQGPNVLGGQYPIDYCIKGLIQATTLHDMCGPSNKCIRSLTLAVTVVVLK